MMTENKVEISRDKGRLTIAATGYGLVALVLAFVVWLASTALPSKIEQIAREQASQEAAKSVSEAVSQATPRSNPVYLAMQVERLTREITAMREEMKEHRISIETEIDQNRSYIRQVERGIDPACIDQTKEQVRSATQSYVGGVANYLPDWLNHFGQAEVQKDRMAGIYDTRPSDYLWRFKSCEAKKQDTENLWSYDG